MFENYTAYVLIKRIINLLIKITFGNKILLFKKITFYLFLIINHYNKFDRMIFYNFSIKY